MLSNPLTKNIKSFAVYLSVWGTIALIYFLLFLFMEEITAAEAAYDALIFNGILAVLGISFWYPSKYISFNSGKKVQFIFSHFIGAVLASAIWLGLSYFILKEIVKPDSSYYNFLVNTLPWRYFIGVLFYFLINSFFYIIIYYTEAEERLVYESELKNLVTEAELRSLKFQINPHFIFNSLNSISALTTIDPEKAREMIFKLADFLRFILATNDKQKNKLQDELKNIRLYLDIEKIRFEDKFDYREEIALECSNIEIPNMLLQPLFENAIKHAVYDSFEKVDLIIRCGSSDGFLKIEVENNYEETTSSKKGTGVGLRNIRERLERFYNQPNLMQVIKTVDMFKVIIFIPLR
jgi:two-component system, LytTR family, sensor kinase